MELDESLLDQLKTDLQTLFDENIDYNDLKVKLSYDGDEDVLDALSKFEDYIKKETLTTKYTNEKGKELLDVNGHDVYVTIKKVA